MAKPLTLEQMVEAASQINLEVLSEEANGAKFKNLYRCKACEFEFRANRNDVKSGKGCPACARRRNIQSRKLSLEQVSKVGKSKGFNLLEPVYKNAIQPMKYECIACSTELIVSHNNVQQGLAKCPTCHPPTRFEVTLERMEVAAKARNSRVVKMLKTDDRTLSEVECLECRTKRIVSLPQLERSGCNKCSSIAGEAPNLPLSWPLFANRQKSLHG